MKLSKAALILGILLVLASNAFAQADLEVASALSLHDVSTENFMYECINCVKNQEQPTEAVVYNCNQDAPFCKLTAKVKSGNGFQTIGTLKFGKSKLYFDKTLKHLMYIQVSESNIQPFDINGIQIPYVTQGDSIYFNEASDWESGRNREYFNTFVYHRGSNAFIQARTDIQTPLNTEVKHGEQLPLILCNQEFFDTISERIRGRNRNSLFWVKKSGENCVISLYRISTKTDPAYLASRTAPTAQQPVRSLDLYRRAYSCGRNHVRFIAISGGETEERPTTTLTNFECNINGDTVVLHCPTSGNPDEERLCEEQTKNVILEAGSTLYYITGGSITVSPAGTRGESNTGTTIQILGGKSVKAYSGRNVIDILPDADNNENSIEIIFSGQLDDERSTAESKVLVKKGKINTKINNQLVDYVLNRPEDTPEAFKYSLTFDANDLKSISEAGKEESNEQRVFGGIAIIRLRVVENLRAFGQSIISSNKVFNLFPLAEGETDIRVSGSYIMYTVTRAGMNLRDIARAQPGMSQLEGSQLVDFMEQIRETSGLYYDEAEGGTIDTEFRGPRDWATPNKFGINTVFRAGDIVLIPTGRTFLGAAGNALTTTDNSARARHNIQQRAQRRTGRAMDDSLCISLGGECHDNAINGVLCNLMNGKDGKYVKNKCLSNPSASYLCCLPSDAENRANARGETQCRQRGGQCASIDEREAQDRVAIDRTCDEQAKPLFAPNDPKKWRYYGTFDCSAGDGNMGVCCGPGVALTGTVSTLPDTEIMPLTTQETGRCATNDDCNRPEAPLCGTNGRCTNCVDSDGRNYNKPGVVTAYRTVRGFTNGGGLVTELDECEGDAEGKYLSEWVCSSNNAPRGTRDTYSIQPLKLEQINCAVAFGPGAKCLTGSAGRWRAAYCGIPDSSIPEPEALTT